MLSSVSSISNRRQQGVQNFSSRSFWLQQVLENFETAEPLTSKIKVDVAIIGGGYVGLWTAIRIKEKSPNTRVAILEKDICGGGASGRNGGFALSWWPKISSLVKLCGRETGLKIARDSEGAIDEIEQFSKQHQEDIDFRKSGWLWTATSHSQMGAWESVVQLCESLGVDVFTRLSNDEISRRCGSSAHRAGVFDHTAAMLHPAKYATSLRRIAQKMGVQIFEQTKVCSFSRSNPIHVVTESGRVIADKLIIANNAWAASIKELSRSIVAITSDMIMTAPAKSELEKIGWVGGEGITDSQTMVDYYQVTKDFRVAFGKGGWGIAYGGCLGKDFDQSADRAKKVEADFRRYYPQLNNVSIANHWCGPIDRTPNSLPLMGRFKESPNIIYGVGWSGNGVGPSVLGGKILSSLALDLKDEWSDYPLVGKSVGLFPPEPIRYFGAHFVRSAVARKESREIEDLPPSFIDVQIAKLAPAGLEDK